MNTIITTSLSTITGLAIGYLIKTITGYHTKDEMQNKALCNILKSNLVNQYYVYAEIGKIPRYVKEAWYDMFESYSELGGNSYVRHSIEPKFAQLEVED